jgi:hypothetical protein
MDVASSDPSVKGGPRPPPTPDVCSCGHPHTGCCAFERVDDVLVGPCNGMPVARVWSRDPDPENDGSTWERFYCRYHAAGQEMRANEFGLEWTTLGGEAA